MTAEQLKNSILQEAISGRLVPQDPNDEPASILLQHIREEKARLVKDGKLKKKDLVETPITDDEKPFEIPDNWEWCRVQQVIKVKSGDGLNVRSLNDKAQYPVYGGNGINGTYHQYNVEADTLVIGRVGFYCGAVHKTYGKAWVTDNALIVSFVKTGIFVDFLKYVLTWLKIRRTSNSTAQPVVSGKGIYPLIFPLPPLAEQKRIVAKLEELLPIVEQYGKAQKELDELNAALPARLRQSILQEAIQGKLTEHDLEDNWAKVYCEKLPKLKYKSSPEWPQEYPFELPENWEWCRIGDICELMNGYAFKSTQYKETGVRVIRITNVQDGYIVDNNPKFYPQIPDIERYALKEGDLLMSLTGNVGRVGILPQSMLPAALNQRVACLRLKDERLKPFLFWYLRCPIFRERCEDSGHGMAQLNISTEWVKQEFFPLPPLAEQQRIVAKIEELFAEIDKMK